MAKHDVEQELLNRLEKQRVAQEKSKNSNVVKDIFTTNVNSYERLLDPLTEEKKTRRINIIVKPSTYEGFKKICDDRGISVNEALNRILDDIVKSSRE